MSFFDNGNAYGVDDSAYAGMHYIAWLDALLLSGHGEEPQHPVMHKPMCVTHFNSSWQLICCHIHNFSKYAQHLCRYTKSEAAVRVMGSIKALFDPNGILNPYKVLPQNALPAPDAEPQVASA